MAVYPRKNTAAIASGSSWALEIAGDQELAESQPFNAIVVQNSSLQPVEFYINGRYYASISQRNYQKVILSAIDVSQLSIKNVGIISLNANEIVVTLTTAGTDPGISGLGSIITKEIDKLIYVDDVARPLMADVDPLRYPSYAQLEMRDVGALTGDEAVYFGTNCNKKLLPLYTYNYWQIQGQRYDLYQTMIKTDHPFSNLISDGDCATWPKLNGAYSLYACTAELLKDAGGYGIPELPYTHIGLTGTGAGDLMYILGATTGSMNGLQVGHNYMMTCDIMLDGSADDWVLDSCVCRAILQYGGYSYNSEPLAGTDGWVTQTLHFTVPTGVTAGYVGIVLKPTVPASPKPAYIKNLRFVEGNLPTVVLSGGV